MKQTGKKLILILTLICVCLFSYKSAYVYANTNTNVLGTASDFSIFVLNDHVHKNSDVTGRVAVGNNATYENYSIGNSLDKSTTRTDLIVGNSLSAINGNNFNGNTAISSNGKITNYTMTNNNNVPNQPKKENIIDFNHEKDYLCAKTKELSSLEANGTVSNNFGQLNLKGSDANLVVFNINTEALDKINGINIDVPESATVIINILGKKVEIGNLSIFYKTKVPSENVFKKWLWNFPQTENLNFYSISVKGSILAPYATFDAKGSGNIEGSVILNNFYNYNAGFEVHNFPFTGSVPSNKEDKATPTPSDEKTNTKNSSDNATKTTNTPKEASTEVPSNTVTKPEEKSSETPSDTVTTPEETSTETPSVTVTKSESTSPKTGDSNSLNVTFSILATSIISIILLRKFK